MAKARTDSPDGAREVRQQKLPLSWRESPRSVIARPLETGAVTSEDSVPAASSAPDAVEAAPADAVPGVAVAVPTEAGDSSSVPDGATPAAAEPAAPPLHAAAGVETDSPPNRPTTDSDSAKPAEERFHVAPLRPALQAVADVPAPAPAAVTGGVGDLLLSARADSGYSIEETSARTRIPRDIIEHLECNAYGQLPSEYYCAAHIAKLCALYNVDSEPVVQQLHADLVAHRGQAEGLAHFQAVSSDSESGSKIHYVLPGPAAGGSPRSLSLTGAMVSAGIVIFLILAVAALTALHFRNRQEKKPAVSTASQVGHLPPVELKEFFVPEQLNAYELPIPAK